MKKIKLYWETDSRNIFLCPQLGFLLYTELLPICLLRKTSNISRRVSRRGIGTVLSTQTQIWPYSSLYFLPKSRASSQLQGFNLLLLWLQETIFFFFGQPLCITLLFAFVSTSVCIPPLTSVPHPEKSGWKPSLLRARRRGDAEDAIWICLQWQRYAGSCCSLRCAVHYFRGIFLRSQVPQEC